jgi:hypothetical protein
MPKRRKPIRDKTTGKEYPSEYQAGLALHRLVGGDPSDRFVWFKIARAFPRRFQTLVDAQWVDVHYEASGRDRAVGGHELAEEPTSYVATATKTTTIEINTGKFDSVKEILGTATLRETVERSFDEVIARAAREKSIEQLQHMDGLDLDKPEVMKKAWR